MNSHNETPEDLRRREQLATLHILLTPILCFIALLIVAALLSGCRSVKYVPVETVRHDSTYIYKVQRDSIHERDSIFVLIKGDTVYKYQYRYLFVDRARVDTFYVNKTDTISVPYPVEVEKKLSWWQQLKLQLTDWLLLGIGFVIIWLVIRNRRK
jgi:hypothetical protein